MEKKASAEKVVRETRRKTRRRFSAEENLRIRWATAFTGTDFYWIVAQYPSWGGCRM